MEAVIIGAVAGVLCQELCGIVKNTFNIDDTLDVFAVHGVGGMFGIVMLAVFGYASWVAQLGGLAVVGVWTIVTTTGIILVTRMIFPLRVDEETEATGLDLISHGERAYDIARRGDSVALAPRRIWVESFRLLDELDSDHARFAVVSGKGAYMRSLARDLARRLGTVGHIAQLRRTAVGGFREAGAISLDELKGFRQSPATFEGLLPVETPLDDIPALALTEQEEVRLRNGQPVPLLKKADFERISAFGEGEIVIATAMGKLVALTKYSAGEVRPVRVLNI